MPLKAYQRGATWWAKGRIEYNGLPVTDYLRESTGASSETGARDWIVQREAREIRSHLVGEERTLSFNDAVVLYPASPSMAKHLIPIVGKIGDLPVTKITPKMVRELGPTLYPNNCADSWRRWVITPTRAVINNAHDLGQCPPIKIKGYSTDVRIAQDRRRGKPSRVEKKPGDWQWLLKFREHARPYHSALALFMFTTGARVGQAVAMHPDKHLDLQAGKVCVPGAKGHDDRWLSVPIELIVELANLPAKHPKDWDRTAANLRVFGFASKNGPLQGWQTACKNAGIDYLPPHSAGRHGFGQENRVRQGIDAQSVRMFGGWSDTALIEKTYTHPEDFSDKINAGFRTGLVQAQNETGLKLLRGNG